MEITRETLRTIRVDIDAALAEIGEKHGLAMKTGNATYDADNATFKLEVSRIADDGVAITKEAAAFQKMARLFGLEPTEERPFAPIGTELRINGEDYIFMGMKPRSRKYPALDEYRGQFVAKRVSDGRMYKFTKDMITFAFDRIKAEV